MKIGILSDTHGRVEITAAALRLLGEAGAEFYVHCGDVGGPAIVDLLMNLPGGFVWGNTDYDRADLQHYARIMGVRCYGAMGELQLGEKKLIVLHGDDERAKARILSEQRCDYLLQGHTHQPDTSQVGCIRLVNPGALHRTARKTVALLETTDGQVRFLPVPDPVPCRP